MSDYRDDPNWVDSPKEKDLKTSKDYVDVCGESDEPWVKSDSYRKMYDDTDPVTSEELWKNVKLPTFEDYEELEGEQTTAEEDWRQGAKDPELTFKFAELNKINLGPNDVLSVKLTGDNIDYPTMKSLKSMLDGVFPNNKVMIFALPPESDILFEVIKPTSTESETK
jgi:hypothetical protein